MPINRRQLLAAAGLVTLTGCGSSASLDPVHAQPAPQPTPPSTNPRLFVLNSEAGSQVGDRLVLQGVSPYVVFFEDRPGRTAGRQPTADFIASWAAFGFAQDPPNAALQIGPETIVYELTEPVYTGSALSFRVAVAPGQSQAPAAFGPAALFIDDAGGPPQQRSLQLSFSVGFQGVINIILGSQGAVAEFSLGSEFAPSGLNVSLPLNFGPVQSFRLTPRELSVQSPGPTDPQEPITVNVNVLASSGIQSISLMSPQSQFMVSTGNGIITVPPNTPTEFLWSSL